MSKGYCIHEITKLTGVSMACLRMWEKRYGWPNPPRDDNQYRIYPGWLVDQLRRVRELVDNGTPIGEIVKDGVPQFPTKLVPVKHRKTFNFENIPQPTSPDAVKLRQTLEEALESGNLGKVEECRAAQVTIRPADREYAVVALLRVARR